MRRNWSWVGVAVLLSGGMFLHGNPVMAASGLKITSPAFKQNETVPVPYTCAGEDISPPLEISGIPPEAKTLALIVDDPDAPMGTWVHWVVYNIPPLNVIAEQSVPGRQALNSFGNLSYGGPCPPSGTHRYFFKLYALDTELVPSPKWTKADVLKAMKGHVLAEAELVGLFKRP